MIFELDPPRAAGPLRIGAAGHDIFETLKQLGVPLLLCRRTPGSGPAWGVRRSSGLFIATFFDADNRLEAIEVGRPGGKDDAVTYDGLDVFTTPAGDLVTQLRQHITIHQEEEDDGYAFTAPSLLLSLWRPVTPEPPDDQEARFFESALIATPGYYAQMADRHGPSRELSIHRS
jgi:hypothetical protein